LLTGIRAGAQNIAVSDYRSYFPRAECDRQAFTLAVRGYHIVRRQELLANARYLSIVDFTKPSNRKRFFVLDLKQHRTVVSSITAHGVGSDPDSCTLPYCFSNRNGSRASSVGFYITGSTYTNHRPSDSLGLCLFGLDKGYNDSAAIREIVVHYGASERKGNVYVTDSGAARSFGCPALPLSANTRVIQLIKDGSCLFIYSPKAKRFANTSTVLTKSLREPIIQQGPPPNNCSCRLQPVSLHE
jgi:hypothetical protein